jgi:ABC-type multidrug transport system fused ATPase/permease subunit
VRPFVAVVVAISLLQLCYIGVDYVDALTFPSIQNHFRRRMMACVLDTYDTAHGEGDMRTGELLSKFLKLPHTMGFWFESVKSLLPYLLVYVAATVYFACIDLALGGAMAVAVTLLCWTMMSILRNCSDVSTRRDNSLNAVQESLDETMHNLPAVYASSRKGHAIDAMSVHENEYSELYFETTACSMRIKMVMVPTVIALVGFTLWRCRRLTRIGKMSVGSFVSVFLVIIYLMSSMMRTAAFGKSMVYQWGIMSAAAPTLQPCLTTPPKLAPSQSPSSQSPSSFPADGCGLRDVWYRPPGSTRDVLRGLTLHFGIGERVAIRGAVGCGKSTLLRLLLRLVRPTRGELYALGRAYSSMDTEQVRSMFGYVPQTPVLFDATVLTNILYGHEDAPIEAVWAVADRIGASETLRRIGIHTPAGKHGSRLSGGQRQLVWLLRVLLGNPVTLLLDEPTSALDGDSTAMVLAAIDAVGTAIVVTHDDTFAESFANRVVTL